jgi:hypothetical protein
VPPGWTAEIEGYFLNATALSELSAAAKTYRLERDAWERAYYELSGKSGELEDRLQSQLAALKREIDQERSAWRSRVRKARSPGIGVFAGAGYSGSGEINAVIGVGLVWKIF